jgi:hypothetical protein
MFGNRHVVWLQQDCVNQKARYIRNDKNDDYCRDSFFDIHLGAPLKGTSWRIEFVTVFEVKLRSAARIVAARSRYGNTIQIPLGPRGSRPLRS